MDHSINFLTVSVSLTGSILTGLTVLMGGALTVGRKFQILDDLKADMAKIKHNLKVIILALVKSEIKLNFEEIMSLSPLRLTEQGQQFVKHLNFYNHPDRNLENTAPTLGLYIRDKYLADYPEIRE